MAETNAYDMGVALIVEGSTERVFYSEFIESRSRTLGIQATKVQDGGDFGYIVRRDAGKSTLVKLDNVGTVTQMTNSSE